MTVTLEAECIYGLRFLLSQGIKLAKGLLQPIIFFCVLHAEVLTTSL